MFDSVVVIFMLFIIFRTRVTLTKWDSKGYGHGQFWLPHDIAIDSSDNVYVVDSGNVHEKKDICAI